MPPPRKSLVRAAAQTLHGKDRACGGFEVVAKEILGHESVGTLLPGRISVQVGRNGDDGSVLRDVLALVVVVACGSVRHGRTPRLPMSGFHESTEVGEVGHVAGAWQKSRSNDSVEI